MNQNNYSVLKDTDAISIDEWLGYILKNIRACYFHTPFYFNALNQTSGLVPAFYCILRNKKIVALAIGEDGSEVNVLPKITKRTIFYAEPLFEDEDSLRILLSNINSDRAGLFLQFRPFFPFTESILLIFKSYGYRFSNHLNAYILLTNEEEIYNNFDKDKRRGIKSASQKYGIKIMQYDNIDESVEKFYEIQKRLYKIKKHTIKSKDYFINLVKTSKAHIKIIFAVYNNEPIASQLYALFGERLTAMYTSTLSEHKDKKAGDLLVWYMIQTALNNKVKYFDFGGGGNPNKSYSPREYKKRFGTRFENSGRLTLPKSPFYKIIMFLYYNFVKH